MGRQVKFAVTEDDIEQASKDQGEFVVARNGLYVLTLKEFNPGFSKDEDGEEDPKRPRVELIWEISGEGRADKEPQFNYGNVWDYVSFSDKSGFRRVQFGKAIGALEPDVESASEFIVDEEEIVGVRVLARLRTQKGRTKEDPPRNKVAAYYNLEDSAVDEDDAFGAAETEQEDDIFGTQVAPPVAEEEGITAEELEGMSLKELGEVATENGLTPQDHIVRNRSKKVDEAKTKAALIEAIMGSSSNGSGESDDPF